MDEASIKRVLVVTGTVATVFGTLGLVRGVDEVRGRPEQQRRPTADQWLANVDSEFRFFAAWYAAVGTQTVRAAVTRGPGRGDVRWIGAAWLASATGRALSIRSRGRPHALYLVLMGVEICLGVLSCGPTRGGTTSPTPRDDGPR